MKLRTFRAISNMTQAELAEKLGVSELSVIKYEGGTTIPSRDAMLKIYSVSGGLVTPNDFFDLEVIANNMEINSSDSTFVAAGLMSGTSMDGIDGALMISDGEGFIKDIGSYSYEYDLELKLLLKSGEAAVREAHGDLAKASKTYSKAAKKYLAKTNSISDSEATKLFNDLCFYFYRQKGQEVSFEDMQQRSTDLHAKVVDELLKDSDYKARSVDIVGYHGQTLYHAPADKITIQIGDGQSLADQTGITVAYDFRSNDVKHGGQGAPFAPLYHRALANQVGLTPVVIANCGGISNITVIGSKSDELYAYDCGPGNGLIDKFVQEKVGKKMDEDGLFGSRGRINESVLKALQEKAVKTKDGSNYLQKQPPKSLDINDSNLIPELEALNLNDGCATLEAFTAECIVESLRFVPFAIPKLWVLAGGGWKNKVITRELEARLKQKLGAEVKVQQAQQVGWSGQFMEAQIFAYLAVRALRKMPLSLPGTTGVPNPLTGGKIVVPQSDFKKATNRVRSLLQ